MNREKYNAEQLTAKIRWEGGIVAALEYGLKDFDIADQRLSQMWGKMDRAWIEFRTISEQLIEELQVNP